jgi:hypothetical protein
MSLWRQKTLKQSKFDYRFTYMPKNTVDLAILLPKRPSHGLKSEIKSIARCPRARMEEESDVQNLLSSLGIEALWFKDKALMGTIHL